MIRSVDLNSDLGEGFGVYRCGDDAAMLGLVSSANIACGLHAGDPDIMADTFARAGERGVSVGAHPGFPDLWGFGRRRIPFSTLEIERLVAYQIGAAQALAALTGQRLRYVKPHGALANIAAVEYPVADAIARAVRAVDPGLALLAIALSEHVAAGEAHGLRVYREIFADRGYAGDGQLITRGQPGALITDEAEAAGRALFMLEAKAIVTANGQKIPTSIDSICVHGDSPHAVSMARRLRAELEAAGFTVAPFTL